MFEYITKEITGVESSAAGVVNEPSATSATSVERVEQTERVEKTAKTRKSNRVSVTKPKTVAEYISWQIHLCGKKQSEIAQEAGFSKPNIITMIKQGKTKLPLEKVGKFAKAIEVDPIHLFKLCMQEYQPDTWKEIERMFNQPVLTANEIEIIEAIRSANVENPKIRTEEERARIIAAIETLKPDNVTN